MTRDPTFQSLASLVGATPAEIAPLVDQDLNEVRGWCEGLCAPREAVVALVELLDNLDMSANEVASAIVEGLRDSPVDGADIDLEIPLSSAEDSTLDGPTAAYLRCSQARVALILVGEGANVRMVAGNSTSATDTATAMDW